MANNYNEILTKEQQEKLIEETDLLMMEYKQEALRFGESFYRTEAKVFNYTLNVDSERQIQLQIVLTSDEQDFL